jgi:hypothetical protein
MGLKDHAMDIGNDMGTRSGDRANVSPDHWNITALAAMQQLVLSWTSAGLLPLGSSKGSMGCAVHVLLSTLGPVLPKMCSGLHSMVSLWEQQEAGYLSSVRHRAALWYFDVDDKGVVVVGRSRGDRSDSSSGGSGEAFQACDVDLKALLETKSTAAAVRRAVQRIRKECDAG